LAGPGHSTLFLDFDASLQTLLTQPLDQYKILHLATHGAFDEGAPDLSAIILSLVNKEGEPVFGYLRPHDVANLTLHSDLVVLSSCDSSGGVNLSGEGTMGLIHAFLSAGATRVLSTLWSVDDETSRRLMVDFYRGILHERLEPAEALRRSQLKIMANPATSAPYFWAGFTITTTVP
jgi:CHAT domain-containing protein